MFRALICCVLIAIGAAAPPALSLFENDIHSEILIVDDIAKVKDLIPEANLIPLAKDELLKGNIRYTLGSRVSGDRLVATLSDGKQWTTPQNVQLSIQYPRSGVGNVVSYVEVLVSQSSNLGQGYVIAGGIGQRSITLVIEARSTLYFSYSARIYGR